MPPTSSQSNLPGNGTATKATLKATEPIHTDMLSSALPQYENGLFWFRRDLRAEDNAGLYYALKHCQQVHCVFIFDRAILDSLPRADRRVEFIHAALAELNSQLRDWAATNAIDDAGLIIEHAIASDAIPTLAQSLGVQAVFTNHDDEPAALERDASVRTKLSQQRIAFHTFKDHTLLEREEVLTQSGTPFSVFTPYKNAWLRTINPFYLSSYPTKRYSHHLATRPTNHSKPTPSLQELGFEPSGLDQLKIPLGTTGAQTLLKDFLQRIDQYEDTRNYPAVKGPSYLSVHLRFGTISPRLLARLAHERAQNGSAGASTWLNELIWRDFYFQILSHYPHVVGNSFKPAYDAITWEAGEVAQSLFTAWCNGKTGYPLVDAAMMQLNSTGYMHNRLRMVAACFLIKDLGIDWRWGERYFAEKLNDFDLAANNGGWQWASSSGCDAQPYFRIFNPITQSEKFDPKGQFIRRYLPSLAKLPDKLIHAPWQAKPLELQMAGVTLGDNYPHPIVDHAEAREKTLTRYSAVKKSTA